MLLLFLRLFFSLVRIIVKVFIEFVTITNSVVYILFFFVCEACGILAHLPGIKLSLSVLEGEI